jgi:hypothetical protein
MAEAGNGSQNLDDPVHDTLKPGYPSDWVNPVTRKTRASGAILVGAGAPPSLPNPRSRLTFSNYGSAVDTQGWGRRVTTTGGLVLHLLQHSTVNSVMDCLKVLEDQHDANGAWNLSIAARLEAKLKYT